MSDRTQAQSNRDQPAPERSGFDVDPGRMPNAVKVFLAMWAGLFVLVATDIAMVAGEFADWEWALLIGGHALNLIIVLLIAARRNWARRVLMALVVLGIINMVPTLPDAFRYDTGQALMGVATHALALISFAVVYTREASDWFRAPRRTGPA